MEPEISWIRDHRKTYEDHCKVLDWCTAHRVEYESIKATILKNMLLAAFTASAVVGGLVYGLVNGTVLFCFLQKRIALAIAD